MVVGWCQRLIPGSPLPENWYSGVVKKKVAKPVVDTRFWDINSPEALEQFRIAAQEFTARHTKTPEAARKILVKEGIYTKAGNLTKHYR